MSESSILTEFCNATDKKNCIQTLYLVANLFLSGYGLEILKLFIY